MLFIFKCVPLYHSQTRHHVMITMKRVSSLSCSNQLIIMFQSAHYHVPISSFSCSNQLIIMFISASNHMVQYIVFQLSHFVNFSFHISSNEFCYIWPSARCVDFFCFVVLLTLLWNAIKYEWCRETANCDLFIYFNVCGYITHRPDRMWWLQWKE